MASKVLSLSSDCPHAEQMITTEWYVPTQCGRWGCAVSMPNGLPAAQSSSKSFIICFPTCFAFGHYEKIWCC